MRKLYRKGQVHPSPPPPPTIADHLSLLPAAILTLTAALSHEDKEVLAYLISCYSSLSASTTTVNSNNNNFAAGHHENTSKISRIMDVGVDANKEHDPTFECNCFSCYMCFWARWDKSPNRQLIHEIIEAYEEELFEEKKQGKKNKKGRKKRVCIHDSDVGKTNDDQGSCRKGIGKSEFVEGGEEGENQVTESEKGSIRKIVNFIGDSIWGVWSRNY